MYLNRVKPLLWTSLLLFSLSLSACTFPATTSPTPLPSEEPSPTPGGQVISGLAGVDTLEIVLLESMPLQARAILRGNLPDGCTTLNAPLAERVDNTFTITLTTSRPADAMCTEALVPFEQVVPLDILNLPKGVYSVIANGVPRSFELSMDNVPVEELTPTPTTPANDGEISGVVWHDMCAVAGGEGGTPAVPSAGCVELPEGGYEANGVLEPDEPGIAGVEVTLGSGACPSTGLTSVTTNADGEYTFENLAPGVYCVLINPLEAPNEGILIPGGWTYPADSKGSATVELAAGQPESGINFGWDHQFLPLPEGQASCTDKLDFVDDVTIPDGSSFTAGETFVKTWQIKNSGTCEWSQAYTLSLKDGDAMGAATGVSIGKNVRPGQTVEVSVSLTAPSQPGSYQGNWLLKNDRGQTFGAGAKAELPFWVKIVVVESTADLDLGDPDYTDSFTSEGTIYLIDTATARFTVENGSLVMTGLQPSTGEEWGLALHPDVSDFYLEATVRTGASCSGRDRYGLLLRAPDPGKGYVYGFTCDGRFRIYRWDGENYNPLQEWTANSAILAGADKTNKIGVMMDGTTIKLYANGRLLAELNDNAYREGRFGLFVASAETTNFKAFVEELKLWELD